MSTGHSEAGAVVNTGYRVWHRLQDRDWRRDHREQKGHTDP